jgi:dimethylhistidine N-methyltransferase
MTAGARGVADEALDGAHVGSPIRPEAAEIRESLTRTPRQLPTHWLYNALGSSLFEAIGFLPWYGVSRAERHLLATHGRDIGRRAAPAQVVEPGCGSGDKLALLLQQFDQPVTDVHLIDVSAQALDRAQHVLLNVAGVRASSHEATYEAGLRALPAPSGRRLVAFLGSNLGNFAPAQAHALLVAIRGAMTAGGWLLLGADLVKPEPGLRLAYDDPLGVTAAFNKNLLLRLNAELGADFDLGAFAHRAVWNAEASRVEMHLVSSRRQAVVVRDADLRFTLERDEPIWTESSYKYEPEVLVERVEAAGFGARSRWIEPEARFLLGLFEAVKPTGQSPR